jgi:hypothetical protein
VPENTWLTEIENLIEHFVLRGLNVSKDKLYRDPSSGGVRLFKPEFFFKALKCSWIKRAYSLPHDNWRRKLHEVPAPGISFLQKSDIVEFGPLLSEILYTLIELRNSFGVCFNNFLTVPVLNNPNFTYRCGGESGSLDDIFFDNYLPNLNQRRRKTLTWMDLTTNGECKSINQLSPILGVLISEQCHRIISISLRKAKKRFLVPDKASMIFNDFLFSRTKKSRPFRTMLTNAWIITTLNKPKCPLDNFATIAGTGPVPAQSKSYINGMWTLNFFPSDIKTFLFKLYHNILGLNSRVHHINGDRDPSCTFCCKAKNLPAERETFQHLFWDCPSVNTIIIKFFEVFFRDGVEPTKEYFLYGTAPGQRYNNAVAVVCAVLKYTLWVIKLKKKLPVWTYVKCEFQYHLNTILGVSRKFREEISSCNDFRQYRHTD